MKKNYVLAFILSFGVLMSWQYFMGRRHTPTLAPDTPAGWPAAPATPAAASGSAVSTPEPAVRHTRSVVFDIGANRISINRFGGGVSQWEIQDRGRWLTLLPEKEFSSQPLSTFSDVEFDVRQDGNALIFSGKKSNGLSIVKTLTISPEKPIHQISVTITNTAAAPLTATYELGWGPGVEGGDETGKDGREAKGFQRAVGYGNGKLKKLKAGVESGTYDWWGVDGHYFLAAFFSNPGAVPAAGTLRIDKEDHYFSVRRAVSVTANPGETHETGMSFYLGSKGYEDLKALGLGLERAVDFGYFAPFGRVIHRALFLFEKGTGNYGWAIIVLTFIIQILVLPLTIKSFQHAQKMKNIQPQMKRLQELYKNDSRRLNSEMLALYQRHGLRFMGMEGCVPMLIQLPVFWALFSTLRNTFELRYAPWMGWVKDLSVHDPFYVLPVLMGAGMFVQQKMTMSSMDPSQKQIMYLMPIIFTFFFLKMPSGLVIYWLTNSLLTIGVQWYLMRRAAAIEVVK
ncbi:MAG: membrane protein insertase YidC [Elusimicrobia bacterium]|nr:membrane protein insertase YidC [Elusimicrobiota bacterium]